MGRHLGLRQMIFVVGYSVFGAAADAECCRKNLQRIDSIVGVIGRAMCCDNGSG